MSWDPFNVKEAFASDRVYFTQGDIFEKLGLLTVHPFR